MSEARLALIEERVGLLRMVCVTVCATVRAALMYSCTHCTPHTTHNSPTTALHTDYMYVTM